jgi:septum site-determining protein MinD
VNDYRVTINDIMLGRVKAESAVYNYDGVKFIPASLNLKDLIGLDLRTLKKIIAQFLDPDKLDFILLDSAPGLGREAVCVLNAADEILFVTNPFVPMVNDVVRCVSVLKQIGRKKVGIVLNMASGRGYEIFEHAVESVTNVPVVGVVPFEKNMNYSLVIGKPILEYNPYSEASSGFMELAANLSGEEYSRSGKIGRIFNSLRNKILEITNSRIKTTQTKKFIESQMLLQEGQGKEELKDGLKQKMI